MKCVIVSAGNDRDEIRRVGDKEAEKLVRGGGASYCPKAAWKAQRAALKQKREGK